MRSQKESFLDVKLRETIKGLGFSHRVAAMAELLSEDAEIQAVQEYANSVSIKRLGYNDHGPVHVRTVALNGLIMMGLLKRADIKTTLELEECGTFDDSVIAVLLAAFLHDFGMSVGRQDHELHSVYIAHPIIDRLLLQVYPQDLAKRVVLRSLSLEGISGHMGTRTIHSLEAGVIQIADGCDMTKGRARIPLALAGSPRVGDIHQYSGNAIEEVRLLPGQEKPIHIEVFMSSEVGLFQVEAVLLGKISASTAKSQVELFAVVGGGAPKRYL